MKKEREVWRTQGSRLIEMSDLERSAFEALVVDRSADARHRPGQGVITAWQDEFTGEKVTLDDLLRLLYEDVQLVKPDTPTQQILLDEGEYESRLKKSLERLAQKPDTPESVAKKAKAARTVMEKLAGKRKVRL